MRIHQVDHVEMYVDDVRRTMSHLCDAYAFAVLGLSEADGQRSVLLGQGDIRLLLTSGRSAGQPAADFVRRHGDGVAVIGLRTDDTHSAFFEAVERGARPIEAPCVWRRRDGSEVVTASVSGFGDVSHRFVQRRAGDAFLPGALDAPASGPIGCGPLQAVDHFAVCVPADELTDTVTYYQRVFGFSTILRERIEIGAQAMTARVVQDPGGAVTLTVIAPDPARQPGRIDDFLDAHEGAGVQRVAFRTADVATAISTLTDRGVRLLGGPLDLLRVGSTLADRDHDGEMLQIFTEPVSARRTLFFELIEHRGARTFGIDNIKAPYQAEQRERMRTAVGV